VAALPVAPPIAVAQKLHGGVTLFTRSASKVAHRAIALEGPSGALRAKKVAARLLVSTEYDAASHVDPDAATTHHIMPRAVALEFGATAVGHLGPRIVLQWLAASIPRACIPRYEIATGVPEGRVHIKIGVWRRDIAWTLSPPMVGGNRIEVDAKLPGCIDEVERFLQALRVVGAVQIRQVRHPPPTPAW